jgi:hypothetical protein
VAGKYSRCKDDGTDKPYAIDAILGFDDAMVFWFPSGTEAGCYAFKPEHLDEDPDEEPDFLPTLRYGQADDLRTLSYHWANDHFACVGSKRELDYWLARARRMERKQAAAREPQNPQDFR